MRHVLGYGALGAAAVVGVLIIPGERASAEKAADPVVVTNVPLSVAVASPRPFVGREAYTIPDGALGIAGGGTFSAPPGAIIETISVRVLLPAGQKPEATLFLPDDTGRTIGAIWVPLFLQRSAPGLDDYVGTLTNVHAPMGATASQVVNFEIDRDANSSTATAQVTVIGVPGS